MKHKIILFLAGLSLLAVSGAASAAPSTQPKQQTAKSEEVQESPSMRCGKTSNDITVRMQRYEDKHLSHATTYKGVRTRLQNITDKLQKQGLDTSGIKEHLAVFEGMVTKFELDYSDYIKKLAATKGVVCSKQGGELAAKLKDAKDALKKVNKDAADIRTYYKTVLRPDLMALRSQANPKDSSDAKGAEENSQAAEEQK